MLQPEEGSGPCPDQAAGGGAAGVPAPPSLPLAAAPGLPSGTDARDTPLHAGEGVRGSGRGPSQAAHVTARALAGRPSPRPGPGGARSGDVTAAPRAGRAPAGAGLGEVSHSSLAGAAAHAQW